MSEPKNIVDPDHISTRSEIGKAAIIALDDAVISQTHAPQDQQSKVFGESDALPPPYDPTQLCQLFENSSVLRQNVDAYTTNIDAFGYRLEPVISLDSDAADKQIEGAIISEKIHQSGQDENIKPVSDSEIAQRKEAVRLESVVEHSRIKHFFDFINPDESFVSIRRKLRQDLEVMGNGYLEILRNGKNEVAQIVYVPGFTVRIMPQDRILTEFETNIKVSPIKYESVKIQKRFRRYIQSFQNSAVYFKEFQDPRVISSKTGNAYESIEALNKEEEGVNPATEILHFDLHSPSSTYGIPRWIGNLLAVLGTRQAEEVNFLLFKNKTIPPMAVLVSGGRLAGGVVAKIKEFLESVKGKAAFHSVLVLEAAPASAAMPGMQTPHTGSLRIELKPLTGAQQTDAMFLKYDERNADKVGQAFRLPRMIRGDIRDFNRSTAEAALMFAEQQVFGPEREDFDFIINRKIMSTLQAKYWVFKSNAPITRDPKALAGIVKDLREVLTPTEAREVAGDILNKDLPKIEAPWTKQPSAFTLQGIPFDSDTKPSDVAVDEEKSKHKKKPMKKELSDASLLVQLRDQLLQTESDIAKETLKTNKTESGELVLNVNESEMSKLFE